jgi:dUTP pyrophosphatase
VGITVVNSPGTIDDDYRGRVKVILQNNHRTTITIIKHGERFAQMAIKPVWYFQWQLVDELEESERGVGGLGSTGVA